MSGKQFDKKILLKLIYPAVMALIVFADQITKNIIVKSLDYGCSKVVIRGFFEISHVHNTGAAWGIFSTHTDILSIVTIFACLLLCFLIFEAKKISVSVTLTFIVGGALGNLWDRVFRGRVIDFLRFYIFGYEFPNFNVADICITVGCFMIAFVVIFAKSGEGHEFFRPGSLAGRLFESQSRKKAEDTAENG